MFKWNLVAGRQATGLGGDLIFTGREIQREQTLKRTKLMS